MCSRFSYLCDHEVVRSQELRYYNTYGLYAKADYFIRLGASSPVGRIIEDSEGGLTLGRGSNVILTHDVPVVLSTLNLSEIKRTGNTLRVGAGVSLNALVRASCDYSLSGLEWAIGIPATVGGGVAMNCGAYNHTISSLVKSVDVWLNGVKCSLAREDCDFRYRGSRFSDSPSLITSVTLELCEGDRTSIEQAIASVKALRKASQPSGNSCGSVFKSVECEALANELNLGDSVISAGLIIDRAGLKGLEIGGAKVSDLHANFIINNGGVASDIVTLISEVKRRVFLKFGVTLEEEVKII